MSKDDDESEQPEVVDFDALNAALGALPPAPTSSSPMAGDSQGRSSATYSSARPHTIPPSHAPMKDELNAPAVIVKSDDTIPSGPPNMTLPMGVGVGVSSGPHPAAGMPPSPSTPFAPQPARAAPPSGDNVNLTVPMVERPRRPRSPTVVVRPREPTRGQKIAVFVAMLIVFVGGGLALLVYYKAVDIDVLTGAQQPPATRSQAPLPSTPAIPPPITTIPASAAAVPVTTPSALPSATTPVMRRPAPRQR